MTELKTSHRNYSDTYTRWYTCHQINEVVFCKKVSSTLRFFHRLQSWNRGHSCTYFCKNSVSSRHETD